MLLHASLCQLSPAWRSTSHTNECRGWKLQRWRADARGFKRQVNRKKKKLDDVSKSTRTEPSSSPSEIASSESKSLSKSTKTRTEVDGSAPRLMTISSSQEKSPMIGQSFEEKLQAIKRSAEEKKRLEQQKMYGPIDYDDVETTKESKAVSFPVKIGIGIAVVVFGLIFAFGDILPSGPTNVQKAGTASQQERDLKDSSQLKEQLQRFLTILKDNPDNLDALEGVAVSYAEVGEFAKAEPTLLQLVERKPMDVEALRLLGEVQSALGKFSESVNSYRKALKISPRSITLWKGLSEGLVSQGKPELAIKEIISERDHLRTSKQENVDNKEQISDPDEATWIQINLLLGKLYAEWDHTTDALAVYDSIIKSNPDDFQGYLAKGILLKKQEQKGEAERMFIQAKFLAPENLKSIVDRYSKQ